MNPDRWLEQYYHGEYFSGNLTSLKEFVEKIGIKKSCFKKILTIGGTNGKGETSRTLFKILEDKNESVALWTSPHLRCVNERFVFSKVGEASNPELISTFEKISSYSSSLEIRLSYFEFLFASFLLLSKEKSIETLVLEVGLGGRLDAVNILDADIVGITSISRDHQDLLGNSYRSILQEKLGVCRQGSNLMTSFELDFLNQETEKFVELNSIQWVNLFQNQLIKKSDDFSTRNGKLALSIAEIYFGKALPQSVLAGFKSYALRKVFKINDAKLYVYPSHNPDGVRKLVHFLSKKKYNHFDKILLSLSDRSVLDLRVIVQSLMQGLNQNILLYDFVHEKAIEKKKLNLLAKEFGLKITDDKSLLKDIQNCQRVLVTGSNYCLGHLYYLEESVRGE